jgi:methylated-DNA-[protein]-cysteine S-methyltransferase
MEALMATEKSHDAESKVEEWSGCFTLDGRRITVSLAASASGLVSCRLVEIGGKAGVGGGRVPAAANPHVKAAVTQLGEYFAGERRKFDVPLDASGTPFQQKVWKAARVIPFGQTRSYWWIAVRLGDPHAMRAVGGALGANPLPLFIPCHRVLRSDGALGGFSAGLEWKRLLLDHETGFMAK